jgi:serine/threonine-protein kinase
MPDEARVLELAAEALDSDLTPEEVCAHCPELLADVKDRLSWYRGVDGVVDQLFPSASTANGELVSRQIEEGHFPTIAGYELLGILGRGGAGVVYRARHLKLNRIVALKMLLSGEYASPAELARFMREAEAIAALQHPNIVQIHEVGEADGRPYFTMELVVGGSLAGKLAGAPQPARYAATVTEALARAIHAAHVAGIVHRDLKPANVLLASDGAPKISDFGLARQFGTRADVTVGEARIGTPCYMAPEQVLGKPGTVGPAADIYALGATLYELLAGRPPFCTETERQTLAQDPAAPSKFNARVPRDLETICLKCLQKEPERRYATATALADDLGRFGRGEPILARRVGIVERSGKWMRRHPARVIAAASAVVLLVVAAMAVGRSLWSRAELQRGLSEDFTALDRFERAGDWGAAREALERAKGRLGAKDVSGSRGRLRQFELNLQLVADLAAIRLSRAGLDGARLKQYEAAARYEKTFDAAELNVDSLPPAEVARRINASPIRNELIAALDDWSACTRSRAQLERIYDVARCADPDPRWRDKVRNASIIDDARALSDLAAAAPIAEQSVSILVALGRQIDLAKGDARPFCRRVQLQHPEDFWANLLLASVLEERHDPESIDYYLAARALRPDVLIVYINLGAELGFHGRSAEALEYAQRAVLIDPRSAIAQSNLGVCYLQLGRFDEAVASCRSALATDPGHFYAVGVMCQALINDGRFAEANDEVQKCLHGMPTKDPLRPAMQGLASRCKDLLEREGHLDNVLTAKEQVVPRRRRQLATVCLLKKRYREAVRLFDEAFAAEPALADDIGSEARFAAASAASRAAEQASEASERARLLNKAVTWLRADVAVWSKVLDGGNEANRLTLLRMIYPWRSEVNLAPIRDAEALRALPPDQQAQCRELWRDVNALLMRGEAAAPQ